MAEHQPGAWQVIPPADDDNPGPGSLSSQGVDHLRLPAGGYLCGVRTHDFDAHDLLAA